MRPEMGARFDPSLLVAFLDSLDRVLEAREACRHEIGEAWHVTWEWPAARVWRVSGSCLSSRSSTADYGFVTRCTLTPQDPNLDYVPWTEEALSWSL